MATPSPKAIAFFAAMREAGGGVEILEEASESHSGDIHVIEENHEGKHSPPR